MNAYAIMSLIALCANIAVGTYVLTRGPKNTINRLFFAVMMSLAVWSAGEFAMRLSKTEISAMWGSRVAATGWCLVGGFFVLFALAFSENMKALRDRRVQVACLLPGVVLLALTWSTHTIFRSFTRSYWGFEEVSGTLRLPSKLFVVIMFAIGGVILLKFWRTSPSRYKRVGAGYVLIALTIPLVAGVVTDLILPIFGVRTVELPMFASTLCAPVIAYAVVSVGIMTTIAGRLGATIITRMNDAVFVTDAEGLIETVNPASARLTGYDSDELLGNKMDIVFTAGPSPDKLATDREQSDVGRWNLCARRDGDMAPVTVSSSEVRRKSGKLLGEVTVAHDMREALRLMQAEHEVKMATARVAAERDRSEVLKASEEEVRKLSRFLESVIENIAEPLFIMDGTLRYVYVNDAFSTLTGCEKDEIIGRGDGELHWEEQAELLTDFKRRVFDGAEPVDMPEVNFCDLEGAIHVTRTVMAPMRNAEGDVEYLVGVINDVTEQKRLESARLDFIRIAAHELRTPLTSLKLGFDILARETRGALNDEQQRSLDILSLSIERLSRLSRNLLDLASMDAGLITLNLQEVELESMFAEAAAVFSSEVAKKGLQMRIVVPPGTRPVRADASRLSQVLYNLVSNAVKYTDEGSITLTAADGGDGMLQISVTDTGTGIPASQKDAIFTRFVKAQSAETAREGTGLGLSITKAIVEAHGGVIKVSSRLGVGSTFSFTVPAAGG